MLAHMTLIILAVFSLRSIKNRLALSIIVAMVLTITLVHVVTVGLVRYAVPLVPYLAILGVRGFFRLIPSLEGRLRAESAPNQSTAC